ncbi:MAG: aspartate-semialdehyde dehydrogenase [Legionellales bacterium]|nr:aspartate-semialdehyde dehydrogenase [Legionellales bacterium]
MLDVAFIGWRGMVGTTLLERMIASGDFDFIKPTFYISHPNVVVDLPKSLQQENIIHSYELDNLLQHTVIVAMKGSEFTQMMYPKLKQSGWKGYWIDAASHLRQEEDSCLILDPINRSSIINHLKNGTKAFIGPNCTTALLLLALAGLIQEDLIEWVSTMTYQAISGAGSKAVDDFFEQMRLIGDHHSNALSQIDHAHRLLATASYSNTIAANVMPWIDSDLGNGISKEEAKCQIESEKILNRPFQVDGMCVRIGSLRCHSQALTIKLKQHVSVEKLESILTNGHKFIRFIPNEKSATNQFLHPLHVSKQLDVFVGRMRYINEKENLLTLFTVGDQLLWGASEPLRRMIRLIHEHIHQSETLSKCQSKC